MGDIFNFQWSDWRGAVAGFLFSESMHLLYRLIKRVGHIKTLALAKTLWRPFIKNPRPTSVVLTKKSSERPSGTPKASLSEVEAFHALRKNLADFKIDADLCHNPGVHLRDLKGHVISVGGPDSNNVTREIIAAATNRYKILPFYYSDAGKNIVAGQKCYSSMLGGDGLLEKDYGLIIRATGLLDDPANSCLVAFGLRGRGTWGAVKALTTDTRVMEKIKDKVGDDDFSALLEFDFQQNELTGTSVISAMTLISP